MHTDLKFLQSQDEAKLTQPFHISYFQACSHGVQVRVWHTTMHDAGAPEFTDLPDLASELLGGTIVFATDGARALRNVVDPLSCAHCAVVLDRMVCGGR
jgi:hypothetical protein